MKIPQLQCKRCGHKWYPRTPAKPKVCPNAKVRIGIGKEG